MLKHKLENRDTYFVFRILKSKALSVIGKAGQKCQKITDMRQLLFLTLTYNFIGNEMLVGKWLILVNETFLKVHLKDREFSMYLTSHLLVDPVNTYSVSTCARWEPVAKKTTLVSQVRKTLNFQFLEPSTMSPRDNIGRRQKSEPGVNIGRIHILIAKQCDSDNIILNNEMSPL